MTSYRTLSFVLLSLPSSSALKAEDSEGFKPLFNGKDLSGWVPCNVAADTFSVKEGMIVTTGTPIGFMRTERMYENFIVELDWRHLKEAGNSGLFIWGEGLPAPGVPYARGIEVQILDLGYAKNGGNNQWFTTHGDIFPIWGASMTPTGKIAQEKPMGVRSFPSEERTFPSPQWNHYRVECNNGEIRLSVNGKEVTTGKDCTPRKGFICLESEGSECHFKNIRIRELPSAGVSAEQTARSYEGFVSLFNGIDLGGWKQTEKSGWASDGVVFRGPTGDQHAGQLLVSEKDFSNYTLCLDWRLTDKPEKRDVEIILPSGKNATKDDGSPVTESVASAGSAGILLRGDKTSIVHLGSRSIGSGTLEGFRTQQPAPAAELLGKLLPKGRADLPFGQWNRVFITVNRDRVSVELNGKRVIEEVELEGLPGRGPIALLNLGSGVEFRNIFIKEF